MPLMALWYTWNIIDLYGTWPPLYRRTDWQQTTVPVPICSLPYLTLPPASEGELRQTVGVNYPGSAAHRGHMHWLNGGIRWKGNSHVINYPTASVFGTRMYYVWAVQKFPWMLYASLVCRPLLAQKRTDKVRWEYSWNVFMKSFLNILWTFVRITSSKSQPNLYWPFILFLPYFVYHPLFMQSIFNIIQVVLCFVWKNIEHVSHRYIMKNLPRTFPEGWNFPNLVETF